MSRTHSQHTSSEDVTRARRPASLGALGGSRNEAGAELRARVGALLATTIIPQVPLSDAGCPVSEVGLTIKAESDDSVDDLVVRLESGGRVFLQVKRSTTLDKRPGSPLVKAVKQFAAAVKGGLGDHDYLVLATARPSKPLQELGELLERERTDDPGGRTAREQEALKTFEVIAGRFLDRAEIGALLAHLSIWQTDPTTGAEKALLCSRLEAELVAVGEGDDAGRELTDVIRSLALLRAGFGRLSIVNGLLKRKVALRSSNDPRSIVAWSQALAEHREREQKRGSTLELFAVPPSLQHLPLKEADAQTLVTVGDDDRSGHELAPLLRRFGRVLLVGAPGGGKSTALRATAARWAQWSDWPVPITVELRKLAARCAPQDSDLKQALLDLACAPAAAAKRAALRAALEHELDAGWCLLLLDGLDEIYTGRTAFIDRLNKWQETLPDSVEMLITARPTVAGEAAPLGLRQLTLRPPDRPWETVSAILDAAAPDDHREAWIDERSSWVSNAFKRDPGLEHTPLSVVTLATTAALIANPEALPRTRAKLLKKALDDVIERWEIARRAEDRVIIGPLKGTLAVASLHIARTVLCDVALGSVRAEREVSDLLVDRLRTDFSLASGNARGAAADAVRFWTETGLFAFDDDRLVARNRPLAEVGLASVYEHVDEEGARQFTTEARARRARWPLLSLASGLSASIAHAWSLELASDGTPDELIEYVEAVRDGALVEHGDLSAIVQDRVHLWLRESDYAEAVVEGVIELPLPASLRRQLRSELLDAVPPDRRLMIEALMITAWDETGPRADSVLREFVAQPRPEPERPRERTAAFEIVLDDIDETYRAAHEAACLRLAQGDRGDAELAANSAQSTSIRYHFALRERLHASGHEDLVDQVKNGSALSQIGSLFQDLDFDHTIESYLGLIANLAAPTELSKSQKRRMDELADCFATAQLNWVHPGLVQKRPQATAGWIKATACLSGLDLAVLAGEARLLADELAVGAEDHGLPFDEGTDRDTSDWSHISDIEETREALFAVVGRLAQSADHQLTLALASAPDPHLAAPTLETLLLSTRLDRTLRFAWMLLVCTEKTDAEDRATGWSGCDDPMLRAAAARWWSYRAASSGQILPAFERALSDDDANVRQAALVFLRTDELTGELRERLEALAASPSVGWLCSHCGAENKAGSACRGCSVVGPWIADTLRELLGDDRPQRPLRFRRRSAGRRLSRNFDL